MELFVLWIAFSIMSAYVASNKGRSGFGFFMLSLIFSPLIGFIGALIAKPKNVSTPSNENSFGENPFKEKDEYEKSSNLADASAEKIKALNKLKEDGLIT